MEATEYLCGREVGERVVIIGGSLTGCEIAYDLILKGKKSIVVEMKNDFIAARGVCLANSSFLRETLALHETPVYLETSGKGHPPGRRGAVRQGQQRIRCRVRFHCRFHRLCADIAGRRLEACAHCGRRKRGGQPAHRNLARVGRLHKNLSTVRQKARAA